MLHKALMGIFEKCVDYFVAIFTAFLSIFSPLFSFLHFQIIYAEEDRIK